MFLAQLQSNSNSTPSRKRRRSSHNATGLEQKQSVRRPIRQTLQRPKPIPPDIGAGPPALQQHKHTQEPDKQQMANMGTVNKPGSSPKSGQDMLVDYLIRAKLVKSPRVAEAMREVDRAKYINPAYASRADAYSVRTLCFANVWHQMHVAKCSEYG